MKNRHTTMLCVRGSTISLFTMCRNDHGIARLQPLRIKITKFPLKYLYDTCKKKEKYCTSIYVPYSKGIAHKVKL